MPFVYPNAKKLAGRPLVGDGECVDIIKELVPGLIGVTTALWKEGQRVKDVPNLQPGTAIATFYNGKFPRKDTGQHAAIFVSHAGAGIWVIDQWKKSGKITLRHIGIPLVHAARTDGSYPNASNNALAFSVIER